MLLEVDSARTATAFVTIRGFACECKPDDWHAVHICVRTKPADGCNT